MFEDLGLSPLSQEDLQQLLLETHEQILKMSIEPKAEATEKPRINLFDRPETIEETEREQERALRREWIGNDTLALRKAVLGKVEPLKSHLVGRDTSQFSHPLAERSVRRALENPQLKPAAEEIVKLMNTPGETWVGAAKKIDETYNLSGRFFLPRVDEESEPKPYVYKYYQTIFAEGDVNSRTLYLNDLFNHWKGGFNRRLGELVDQIEKYKRMNSPLSGLCELEYKSFILERLKEAIKGRGRIESRIPFYLSDSLTFLEETKRTGLFSAKGMYAFRAYGSCGETVDDIMERTLGAQFSVRKANEFLSPMEEPLTYFSVKF